MAAHGAGNSTADRKPNRGPIAGPANRRALIAAARQIFAEDGLQAPYSSIAKRAGVGQGSLYRHFPDRLSIAIAVFDENIDELEAGSARPGATLDTLFDAIIDQATISAAIIQLIWDHRDDERVARFGERIRALADTALAHEQSAGRVGAHVRTEDVLLAITMLATVSERSDGADPRTDAHRARELIDLAFEPR